MKHKWLVEGLDHGMDVEHAVAMGDRPAVIVADEVRQFTERQINDIKQTLAGAQEEHDEQRAELAEADPETHAIERDQHNNPIAQAQAKLTRKQRRWLAAANRSPKKAKKLQARIDAAKYRPKS